MAKVTLYRPDGTVKYDKVSGVKINGNCVEFRVQEGCVLSSVLMSGQGHRVMADAAHDVKTNVPFVVEEDPGS
jgi:hypothetical protein